MDWDDLRIFLTVAREESLSRAGRRLTMDASTVGRRVSRLERALGAELFAKTPQGYALLPAGQRLLPHAEAVEAATLGAGEALGGDAQGISGQLRIGAPDGCANFLLPQVAAELCHDHPGLEVQIVSLPRVANLSRREADFAIAVSRPASGRVSVQKLSDYHLHLAAHHHLAAQIKTKEDLRRFPMIGYISDMIFDPELDYLAETGASAPALSSNSAAVQLQALRTGGGVGIVHDFALPFAPELRQVLTKDISLRRTFWLIRHEDDRKSERLSRLGDALLRGLRREIARLEAQARTL